ncbi:MAG: TetR/AcrR family transcriptional regulator [Acidimicrobiales bacterium]
MALSKKVEQGKATRRLLLDTARQLFAARGYDDVSADELVRAAGVTKGALYHHFRGKAAVFEAVYEEVLAEFDEEISEAGSRAFKRTGEPWAALQAGLRRFLDLCIEPRVMRIVLIEAPAALGWPRWEQLDTRFSVRQLGGILERLMASGDIERQPVEPLAGVLVGALNQAGRLIARSPDPKAARRTYGAVVDRLFEGLRPASHRTDGR